MLTAVAVAALALPGIARADCATVSVSPSKAVVGQIVTATAQLTDGGNCGDADRIGWSQNLSAAANAYPYSTFTSVAGCGTGAASCVLRVHYVQGARPTVTPLCLQGPGWADCGSTTIYPATIRGTVTTDREGHLPEPAAGVVVSGGGQYASYNTSTLTNARGQYVLVLPGGKSVISAGRLYGPYRTADPAAVHFRYGSTGSHGRAALNTDLLDIKGNIDNLNFVSASCAETHTCPLKVFVRTLQTLRSGLGLNSGDPRDGPVTFSTRVFSKSGSLFAEPDSPGQRCKSGCVNVLVGVVDPQTNANVADASVDASVAPTAAFDGRGFLCFAPAHQAPRCGASLTGLKTDKNGKLHLLYWAPGEIAPESTQLSVTASGPRCTDASCPAPFTEPTTLSVTPYPIYAVEDAVLEPAEVGLLVEMAREQGLQGLFHELLSHGEEHLAIQALIKGGETWFNAMSAQAIADAGRTGSYAYELLEKVEGITEAVAARSELLATKVTLVAAAALEAGEVYSAYAEQTELVVLFLSAFRLNTLGLDIEPHQTTIPDLNPDFESLILARSWVPTKLAAGGVMWSLARTLAQRYDEDATSFEPLHLALKIYEVSSCDENELESGRGVCGPGYYFSGAIRPMLDFVFSAPGWQDSFSVPYDPRWWVPGQMYLSPSPA